ncbi:hypothetical protein HER32_15670 [Hymenobacter sp. BT18]|uniref:hypothetical protein n=1 Tax=Hymenobacter sp. BT18 TaxID=2835648 RepID=UPI00143E8D69|nr:hypothetical protein [Hymenobacter sp. BT18]QIX62538.1 hypothetical protein HER32_15670 [Hymenobacter sp. BT18]
MFKNIPRLGLWLALLPLAACQDKLEELKDATRFSVALRVKGENLTGLGAEMDYVSTRNTLTKPEAGPSGHHTYAISADTTYQLGEFGVYDDVLATIVLRKATCDATTHPRPGSYLKLDMLVNGVVYDTETLSSTSGAQVTCTPYWTISVGPTSDGDSDWDD